MVPDYGRVWCDDNSIANIFYLANLDKIYRFNCDSHKNDAFAVQTNRGIINFRSNKQGTYVFNPTYTTANSKIFTTVEYNMVGFKSRKI